MDAPSKSSHKWQYRRMGGLDQIEFRNGEDIRRLASLDPKLWVALSCPAAGLEFDQRTLTLVDTDGDGRIRIPEIIAAADWISTCLKDPGVIVNPQPAMPLDVVADADDAGKRLAATGRVILNSLGKPETAGLTQEDVSNAVLHASEQMFNGDGILPPLDGLEKDVRDFIEDAIAVSGGIADVGGSIGINKDIADAFMKTLEAWSAWNDSVGQMERPLGENTPECWDLLIELKDKIDDYFLRCELIAYAPESRTALNLDDKPLVDEIGLLEQKALADLPLSKAGPEQPLNLEHGLNPAWRSKVERFGELVKPLLAKPGLLARKDWLTVQNAFAPFSKALAGKPAPEPGPGATVAPVKPVDLLGEARIREILDSGVHPRFVALAESDADGPAAAADIANLERLVLYYLHLHRLLVNFVNFQEFYDLEKSAAFQSGHLFIDGRSCDLCMPAADVDAHSAIAEKSQLYLLYCACTRAPKAGEPEGEKAINVVAAMTAGDSDLLGINRNGVYVDSFGNDWDARVVKMIANPIGLWQAVWSPYKRIGQLVTDQIGKYANEKQAGMMASATKKLDDVNASVAAGAPPARFDIGRNVGLFAAVGLALGAIGTAVGSIVSAVLSMSWWQLPLLLLAIFIVISGPSMVMAWLKLRQRTLGPLLEASGWAINGRVRLTYSVAERLSATAAMPPNARRSQYDVMMRARRIRIAAFWIAVAAGVLAALVWFGGRHISNWMEKTRQEITVALEEAAAKAQAPEPSPAAEAPAAETPAADTPPAETPAAETPPTDTPPAEAPAAETPAADTPPAEAPAAETPAADTPPAETPAAETPPTDTPPAETPAAETPPTDTPPAEAPAAETPAAETPPAEAPAAQ